MKPVIGANQLSSDAQSVTTFADGTLEHVIDAEFRGNGRNGFARTLVAKRGCSRGDQEIRRTHE